MGTELSVRIRIAAAAAAVVVFSGGAAAEAQGNVPAQFAEIPKIRTYGGWVGYQPHPGISKPAPVTIRKGRAVRVLRGNQLQFDLGPGPDGRPTVIYSTCLFNYQCSLSRMDLSTKEVQPVPVGFPDYYGIYAPAIWKDRVAFVHTIPTPDREGPVEKAISWIRMPSARPHRVAGTRIDTGPEISPVELELRGSRLAFIRAELNGGYARLHLQRLTARSSRVVDRAVPEATMAGGGGVIAPSFVGRFLYWFVRGYARQTPNGHREHIARFGRWNLSTGRKLRRPAFNRALYALRAGSSFIVVLAPVGNSPHFPECDDRRTQETERCRTTRARGF